MRARRRSYHLSIGLGSLRLHGKFSIPATSAKIEQVFSTAGKILRTDCCRPLPRNLETLLFLKVNSDLL